MGIELDGDGENVVVCKEFTTPNIKSKRVAFGVHSAPHTTLDLTVPGRHDVTTPAMVPARFDALLTVA